MEALRKNKYKEYIYNHDIKDTAIKVCSEYYMNKVFTNNEYCKNNIDYHYYYDITDKDYIVEINDYEAFLEYLKDNNITHDRGGEICSSYEKIGKLFPIMYQIA